MRSPEYNNTMRRPPDGKQFENEYYQYLAPESFTVLQPAGARGPAPIPPQAPEPYKVPSRKRNKNQAFAIIAEPTLSVPGSQASSRAGSPTGRVSPFRGRGFNPAGSRHASPAPSPPPGSHPLDREITSLEQLNNLGKSSAVTKLSSTSTGRLSQIPILKSSLKSRRSSAEDILSPDSSPNHRSYEKRQRLPGQTLSVSSRYSQSMTNIAPRNLIAKPPPSPRRSTLKQSFVRLSPIIGSSPEAGESSPSRIPRSRSQPPSRLISPQNTSRAVSRAPSRANSRPVSRAASRPVSRNPSRNVSRETSPTGNSSSPSKTKNSVYRNIPAKVDSFNRSASSKPKVPIKPKVYSIRNSNNNNNNNNIDRSRPSSIRKPATKFSTKPGQKKGSNRDTTEDTTDTTEDTERERELVRRDTRTSINSYNSHQRINARLNGNSRSNSRFMENDKPSTSKSSSNEKSSSGGGGGGGNGGLTRTDSRSTVYNGSTKHSQSYRRENGAKDSTRRRHENGNTTEDFSKTEDEETEDARDDDILSVTIENILENSTQQIVATTTETVVKPLNIEAKLIKQSDVNAGDQTHTSNTESNTGSTNQTRKKEGAGNTTGNTTSNPTTVTTTNTNTSSNTTSSSNNATTNSSSNNNPNNLNVSSNGSVTNTPKNATSNINTELNVSNTNGGEHQVNNNQRQLTNLTPSVNSLESVKNNFNNLTPPDSDKVRKNLMDSANDKLKQSRTVIVDEIRPIKITVREKSGDVEVQSGNYVLPRSATNGIAERPLVPPNNHPPNSAEPPPTEEPPKQNAMSKFFSWFKKSKQPTPTGHAGEGSTLSVAHNMEVAEAGENASIRAAEEKPPTFWNKFCKRNTKVGDSSTNVGCLPKISKSSKRTEDENWAERRDSIISEPPRKVPFSQKLKKAFGCGKKKDDDANRRASMMSKKKSMSSTMQPPIEDTGPKLEASLVEHASHMRGAIPVLPVPLAWTCLIFNVFLPGVGTILSGLICLCIGKPRFSPRDSAKARFGAFLIDIIVGISQCFTVLFCLVGWGWSIWWGVIMLKIARKHRRIRAAEKNAIEDLEETAAPVVPSVNINHHTNQDVERGRT